MLNGKQCLIDLHLHLDGSLSIASVKKLAALQSIPLPEDDLLHSILSVGPECRDLNEYLEKFDYPLSLLQTPEGIAMSVSNLLEELSVQGLMYAEIRFAPQLHLMKGLSQRQVVEAAIAGLKDAPIPCGLILCCMRMPDNKAENLETVRLAKDYLGKGVVALDLAGAEAVFPTKNFCEEFALARELAVPYTIHAGEADGRDSIYTALEFGTKRIGHGIRAWEDPALLKTLAAEGITLECCPTSNLNTQIFQDLRDYPIPVMLEEGVRFTVNTDNMTVSNTTLAREWQLLMDHFPLERSDVIRILLNAVDAAFASDALKAELRKKIHLELA